MSKLSARTVVTAKPGRHGDGRGLWLHVAPSGAKKWLYRYTWQGRVTETGLGSASLVTLLEAREKAQQCRLMVARGINPVEAKRAATAAITGPKKPTFGEVRPCLLPPNDPRGAPRCTPGNLRIALQRIWRRSAIYQSIKSILKPC